MVLAANVYKSTKRVGKYEERIIRVLTAHFVARGYEVVPHSSLNFAWGCILSDVDLLLIKNNLITYIEVKSHRDNFARVQRQIERSLDYFDYVYVATDRKIKNWASHQTGLIQIDNDRVTLIQRAKKLRTKPRYRSIVTLKKKCIARFFGADNSYIMSVNKCELAQIVFTKEKCTRSVLREIVTCGELCSNHCPVLDG